MSTRYKPGSRIAAMWEAFERGGPEACGTLAPSLKLAEATIKNWIGLWSREKKGGAPTKKAVEAKAKSTTNAPKMPKRIPGYKFSPTGKARVKCSYMPNRLGWLIEAGPEVSEVRWDDEFPEVYIINRFLSTTGEKNDRS